MSKLHQAPYIIIDCQSTGMRPSVGSLLEISWRLVMPDDATSTTETYLVALPEDEEIPWRVRELTGIDPAMLEGAVSKSEVAVKLKNALRQLPTPPRAVIHYAQFEKPWLEDLLDPEYKIEFVCTYRLTKKLFPHLPSRNVRAVSGFFGKSVGQVRRAGEHVDATFSIWEGLREELQRRGVEDWSAVDSLLVEKPKKALPKKYEYRIDKEKRLGLPPGPGVYRMLSKSGEILYVGKATSLRDRVNSYFRGYKGRDPRKLEMLAQVWDLNYTECKSPLEAALLETDEIKRLDPPYNVTLKRGKRKLAFYSRDFDHAHLTQDETHPRGAFKVMNPIEDLRPLLEMLKAGAGVEDRRGPQVFRDLVEPELINEGLRLFRERHALAFEKVSGMRSLLSVALWLYRLERRKRRGVVLTESVSEDADSDVDVVTDSVTDSDTDEVELLTAQEVSEKFDRLFLRAGRELWRAKHLTRLLYSEVSWRTAAGLRTLKVSAGRFVTEGQAPLEIAERFPWAGLDIGDYDRMSVLYSGVSAVEHSVRPLASRN